MANIGHGEKYNEMRRKCLFTAAKLFVEKGYMYTSLKEIAEMSGTNTGMLNRTCGNKDDMLAVLVEYVLKGQFSITEELVKDKTDDKILFYAAETTLQLHMVESNENIRELYSVAYSLPVTTKIIQQMITEKLEGIFKEHLPNLETQDFYMLEIASGGIMRGFMTIPCDMWFTMDKKIKAFLETTFKVYDVPQEKIAEAIEFVKQFDFEEIAKNTIQNMIARIKFDIREIKKPSP